MQIERWGSPTSLLVKTSEDHDPKGVVLINPKTVFSKWPRLDGANPILQTNIFFDSKMPDAPND
jgi:hypothetical protein